MYIQSAEQYSQKDLESLRGLIDDELLAAEYQRKGYKFPKDLTYLEEIDEVDSTNDFIEESNSDNSNKPGGLFRKLFIAFSVGAGVSQGINDATPKRVYRYRIGDRVRVKYRGQEGTIIDINGDLYTVSLSDGGYVDSYYENQLEKAR